MIDARAFVFKVFTQKYSGARPHREALKLAITDLAFAIFEIMRSPGLIGVCDGLALQGPIEHQGPFAWLVWKQWLRAYADAYTQ